MNKFDKLSYCLEKGIDYFSLLKPPRYDHRGQVWVVLNEGGERHAFDEENEAEEFYNNNMPRELQ